ncbi:MAG TPA: TolC family protein [Bryobacteraceae bacterium]|nr:TolC family protein [Bryobacteraceae bacterium]
MKQPICGLLAFAALAPAQAVTPPSVEGAWGIARRGPVQAGATVAQETPRSPQAAPVTLTLKDALALAERNEPQLLARLSDARIAHEDARQARETRYPSFGVRSEFLNTQGNGVLPTSRYVTADGVHVYREWATMHQDLNAGIFTGSGVKRADEAELVAQAKVEIARRGLGATVTKAYYALLLAQRRYATFQQALDEAQRFVTISQNLERGGEVAHSDVVKSQLQQNSQTQVLREAELAMEAARLELAVLLYRDFNENFQIVDDLNLAPALPPLSEVQVMAARNNPDVRAAIGALRGAETDVKIARQAFLPSLSLDLVYGLEANAIALRSVYVANPEKGPVPTLGYFLDANLTIPVWDWGSRRSRVRQAELRREQANVELSSTQRELVKNLDAAYREAQTARDQRDLLRQAADLASENLRLNNLRYQAGEATVLEIVDAQNSLIQARTSLDDGEVRYRVAIANLQALTGPF